MTTQRGKSDIALTSHLRTFIASRRDYVPFHACRSPCLIAVAALNSKKKKKNSYSKPPDIAPNCKTQIKPEETREET
jgi:hypothetical protein